LARPADNATVVAAAHPVFSGKDTLHTNPILLRSSEPAAVSTTHDVLAQIQKPA
jgi:hypothetical protein